MGLRSGAVQNPLRRRSFQDSRTLTLTPEWDSTIRTGAPKALLMICLTVNLGDWKIPPRWRSIFFLTSKLVRQDFHVAVLCLLGFVTFFFFSQIWKLTFKKSEEGNFNQNGVLFPLTRLESEVQGGHVGPTYRPSGAWGPHSSDHNSLIVTKSRDWTENFTLYHVYFVSSKWNHVVPSGNIPVSLLRVKRSLQCLL